MTQYKKCPNCGAHNPLKATHCLADGYPLDDTPVYPNPERPGSNGNNRGVKPPVKPVADCCDLIDRIEDATVFIISISPQEGGTGTGFFVKHENETYLITNFHVVKGGAVGGFTTVRFSSKINKREDNILATILAIDPINDLALLDVHCPIPAGVLPLELADTSSLRKGQDVVCVGNPRGMMFNSIKGTIANTNLRDESFQMSRILCSLNAANGNSGGPVVRISDGLVIGVATQIFAPEYIQSHTICVSTDTIRNLIYMYKKSK